MIFFRNLFRNIIFFGLIFSFSYGYAKGIKQPISSTIKVDSLFQFIDYVGTYRADTPVKQDIGIVLKEQGLFATADGFPPLPLLWKQEDEFSVTVRGYRAVILFIRENGIVGRVRVEVQGMVFEAIKR